MKILIADNNPDSRRKFEDVLAKWGYKVIVAGDGAEAWNVLQAKDAPPVAILNCMLPVMSEIDICVKLRGTNSDTYTYVILLAEQADKMDVITYLDSGADNCLIKPIEWEKLRALLKVAERITEHQFKLQQRISSLESSLVRDDVIGDQEVSASAPKPSSGSSSLLSELRPILEIDQLLPRVFAEMGVGAASAIDPATFESTDDAELIGWSAVIFKHPEVWLDIKMEFDRASANALFQTLTGSPASSDEELLDTLSETLNIFQGYFKATFDEEDVDILSPIVPKAMLKKNLPEQLPQSSAYMEYAYSLPDIKVRLTLIEHASPIVLKTAFELKSLDVLAEPLHSPKKKEDILLYSGVILTTRYIAKLQKLAASIREDLFLSVVEASPLTKALFSQSQNL
jgi:DNA-binding response OmpR family regulator